MKPAMHGMNAYGIASANMTDLCKYSVGSGSSSQHMGLSQ